MTESGTAPLFFKRSKAYYRVLPDGSISRVRAKEVVVDRLFEVVLADRFNKKRFVILGRRGVPTNEMFIAAAGRLHGPYEDVHGFKMEHGRLKFDAKVAGAWKRIG